MMLLLKCGSLKTVSFQYKSRFQLENPKWFHSMSDDVVFQLAGFSVVDDSVVVVSNVLKFSLSDFPL